MFFCHSPWECLGHLAHTHTTPMDGRPISTSSGSCSPLLLWNLEQSLTHHAFIYQLSICCKRQKPKRKQIKNQGEHVAGGTVDKNLPANVGDTG